MLMFFPPVLLLFIWNKLKKKDTKQKPTMIQQRNLTYTITVWYIHYLYIVYLLTVKKKQPNGLAIDPIQDEQ